MAELDEIWSQLLDDAARRAEVSGRNSVAEYLRLKATNDMIRERAVSWLFDTVLEIASQFSRANAVMTIEREEPHNFARGSSNMVGSRLNVRHGVRCLSVEAGWARTPSDGIMHRGALAVARISHFGIPRAAAEFRLLHADSLPKWLDDDGRHLDSAVLEEHLRLLIG